MVLSVPSALHHLSNCVTTLQLLFLQLRKSAHKDVIWTMPLCLCCYFKHRPSMYLWIIETNIADILFTALGRGSKCDILTCNSDLNHVAGSWINQSSPFGDLVEAGVLAFLSSPHWPNSEDSRLGFTVRLWDNGCRPWSLGHPQQKEGLWFVFRGRLGLRPWRKGGDQAAEGEHVPTFYHTSRGLNRQDRRRESVCGVSRARIWRSTGRKRKIK